MIGQILLNTAIRQMELGHVPDRFVRWGIRRLCRQRKAEEKALHESGKRAQFVESLTSSRLAINTDEANEQHYELPAEFFSLVLGKNRKYSGCFWPEGTESLDEAEDAALAATVDRAGIVDGQDILELGCGWGSLTLYMAQAFPNCRITAVSNSHSQRRFIQNLAQERGLANVRIITADMNDFQIEQQFDRIVSVEMFEHMRNYEVLFARISNWLRDDGRLFVHVFCHKEYTYPFETEGGDDWMGKYFFTGGIMPAQFLFDRFNTDLHRIDQWAWDGTHYEKTANAWLAGMDDNKARVMEILRETYGPEEAKLWFQRWRVFFMACAELFGMYDGEEWFVAHTLFGKTRK